MGFYCRTFQSLFQGQKYVPSEMGKFGFKIKDEPAFQTTANVFLYNVINRFIVEAAKHYHRCIILLVFWFLIIRIYHFAIIVETNWQRRNFRILLFTQKIQIIKNIFWHLFPPYLGRQCRIFHRFSKFASSGIYIVTNIFRTIYFPGSEHAFYITIFICTYKKTVKRWFFLLIFSAIDRFDFVFNFVVFNFYLKKKRGQCDI